MTGKACGNAVRSKAASWRGFAHGADRGKGSGVWKKILDHGEEDCGNTSMKFGVKTATVILFGLCIGCDELVELSPPGTVHRIGEKVTVRDVESAVAARGQKSRKGSVRRDPNILAQEKLIEERLGTKVRISKKGERGTIVIDFYSKEELDRLLGELT